jgi:tetratricopeptide (TPR) repeat protein
LNRGEYDAAIEILEKAAAQTPNDPEAHFFLGSAYGAKVQETGMLAAAQYASKIREEFEKAVELNPKYAEARYALVQVYASAPALMGGSTDKALEQAKAIKLIDPMFGHRAYAFVYAQQKKLDLAKNEYVELVREQPRSAEAHSHFGQYLTNVEKDYPAAFAEFEAALKAEPTYMPVHYYIGRTAALGGTELARGEASLRKYLGHVPQENEPPLANAHFYLGSIYEKEGKMAEAKKSYEAALKLRPTHKRAAEALKRMA